MLNVKNSMKSLVAGNRAGKWMIASAVAAAGFAMPTFAHADQRFGDRDDHRVEYRNGGHDNDGYRGRDYDRDHDRHDGGRFNLDIRIGDRSPRFEERQTRVLIPAVYRTECEKVWVAPVYRTVCEKVWVPDEFEFRTVRVKDHGRWCNQTQRVLVRAGHYEDHERQVCVTEGHYENVERQVLVTPAHYETRIERVAVNDDRCEDVSPLAVVNPMFKGLGIRLGK